MRETKCFWWVKCLGLSKTLKIGVFSDTMNVINVKRCMMVLLIELYLFIPLSLASVNLNIIQVKLKLCRIVK